MEGANFTDWFGQQSLEKTEIANAAYSLRQVPNDRSAPSSFVGTQLNNV